MKEERPKKGYRYQQLLFKYRQLQQRISRSIARGSFYNWNKKKREQLLARLQRYAHRLNLGMPSPLRHIGNSLLLTSALISQTPATLSGQAFIVKDFALQAFGISNRNSSNPTFVDIDGDGDSDVFIGEANGDTRFYRNTGSETNPVFALDGDTTPFGIPNVGVSSKPTFVDIDNDGDFDAFIGTYSGDTRFFRNTGSKTNPVFSAEGNFGIGDIGANSSPTFVDIDNDGDFDAFIGEDNGSSIFYRNTGSKVNPVFSLEGNATPFGIGNVGGFSTPTFVDIDDDGDFDAFIGELYGSTRFFRNTGSKTNPVFLAEGNFGIGDVEAISHPSFVDIDGDGDFDAFIGEFEGNTIFHRNIGTKTNPMFNATSFGIGDVGDRSSPTFVDIDDDGDFDAFIGDNSGSTNFFRNTGSKVNPVFSAEGNFDIGDRGYRSAPTFVDIDGDGDFDAFIGEGNGSTRFFRNTGSKTNPVFSAEESTAPFGIEAIGRRSILSFVDIDDDGDFDVFIGEGDGNTTFFRNTGNKTNPVFSVEENFGIRDIGNDSSPSFIDIDGDGDFDAFIGGFFGNIRFFRNTGSKTNPSFSVEENFGIRNVGGYNSPSFIDIDDDGDFDAFVGERNGRIIFFENIEPIPCSNEINVTAVLANTNKKASNTITTSGSVMIDQTVVYQAGASITLNPGFHAMTGSDFSAVISTCILPLKETAVVAYSRNVLSDGEMVGDKKPLSLEAFPNPFTNEVKLQYQLPKKGDVRLQIVSLTGQTLLNESKQSAERGIFEKNISTRGWPTGMYYIQLATEREQVIFKIVKGN